MVGWGNGRLASAAKRGNGMADKKDREANHEATPGELATSAYVRATGGRLARRLKVVGVGVIILIMLEIVSIGVSLGGRLRISLICRLHCEGGGSVCARKTLGTVQRDDSIRLSSLSPIVFASYRQSLARTLGRSRLR